MDDVELIELAPDSGARRRRRRRRKGRKAGSVSPSNKNYSLISAANILSSAAREDGLYNNEAPSSPSSFAGRKGGRKMSALELDVGEEFHHLASCSTGTPGSLDSSRSLWELGTVEADEDEILLSPQISARRQSSGAPDVNKITAGIDEILRSIPAKFGKSDLSRLCVPKQQSNRLCIDSVPRGSYDLFSGITSFFETVKSSVSESFDTLASKLLLAEPPREVALVLQSLSKREESGIIPSSSVPALNRRQRRTLQRTNVSC